MASFKIDDASIPSHQHLQQRQMSTSSRLVTGTLSLIDFLAGFSAVGVLSRKALTDIMKIGSDL